MPSLHGSQKNITTFITDFFLLFCVIPLPIIRKQIIILTQPTYKEEEPQHVVNSPFYLYGCCTYIVDLHNNGLPLHACKCVGGEVMSRYNQSPDNLLGSMILLTAHAILTRQLVTGVWRMSSSLEEEQV